MQHYLYQRARRLRVYAEANKWDNDFFTTGCLIEYLETLPNSHLPYVRRKDLNMGLVRDNLYFTTGLDHSKRRKPVYKFKGTLEEHFLYKMKPLRLNHE